MKRVIILLLLCIATVLSIAACNEKPSNDDTDGITDNENNDKNEGDNSGDNVNDAPSDDKHTHVLIYKEAKAATCTEDGNVEYYSCGGCNKTFSDSAATNEITETAIAAKGHNAAHVEAKNATCTEDGNAEHWFCSECDKAFADEELKNELSTVVIAAGHSFSDEWSTNTIYHWREPLCDHDVKGEHGEHSFKDGVCTVCGSKEIIETKGLAYATNDDLKSYKITGMGAASGVNIVIPAYIDGTPVTAIAPEAFQRNQAIQSIVIPDTVEKIDSLTFSGCQSLTSITIGNGVTSIGNYAFEYCYSLTSVEFAENSKLTSIGDRAFYICDSLTSVTIPDSVTSISESAFYSCDNLTSIKVSENNTKYKDINGNLYSKNGETLIQYAIGKIDTNFTIPNSVTSIGNSAFSGCNSLTSVTIPNNVTSIGNSAFYSCDSLTSVTIPNSVTSIGNSAFRDCTSLTSIKVSENNTKYKDINGNLYSKNGETLIQYAIGKIDTNFTIPDSVTSICDYAFEDCSSLTSVTIGNRVTSIGNSAFSGCHSLTSVTIGNSVTSIGNSAFYYCSNLVEVINKSSLNIQAGSSAYGYAGYYAIEVHKGESKIVNKDGFLFYTCYSTNYLFGYEGNKTDLILPESYNGEKYEIYDSAFSNCDSLTSVTIGNSVTSIGNYAFYSCDSLTSVTIGNSVTSIGDFAFSSCTSLTSVTIPDNVTIIGNYAFHYCTSLTSVTIGNSVTSIGDSAFSSCNSLTSVTISNSVTSIGGSAFGGCTSLTSIKISENNTKYKDINGNLYSKNGETLIQYAIGKIDTNFTIPDSVTSIGDEAFCYCRSLTSVTIPDSVTRIGDYAFYQCNKLVEVINKSSLNIKAGSSAYGYAGYYAKEVHNGESKIVNKDGFLFYTYDGTNYLLGYVGNETELILPKSYNGEKYEIYDYAFYNCTSLTSVTIGNSVTSIGNYAFEDCSSLTSVTIGNSVTSIGNYAFEDCSSLTSVTIGNSVTSIGDRAFYNCRSLTSVTIPDSVTSIGDYAFYFCNKLVEVINKSSLNIQAGSKDYGYAGYYAKEVHNGESKIVNKDGFLFYTYDGTNYLLGYVGNETELILPESYNGEKYEIYKYAFHYCRSLTSVTIGNSVTSIGSSAFWGCSSLTSVTIGNSVTSIGDSAFYNCNSLTSVTFENPNGWWYSLSSTATSGTAISSTDLSNTWEAAQFLKSFYCDYYWRRG